MNCFHFKSWQTKVFLKKSLIRCMTQKQYSCSLQSMVLPVTGRLRTVYGNSNGKSILMIYGKRFFPRWNHLLKKPTLDDNDQPSTSGQLGAGGSSDSKDTLTKPYFIWKRDTRTFKKNWVRDTTFKVKFNEQWQGNKLMDIQNNMHDMFEDLLSQARGHDADLGRVVISHPSLNNAIVVPLQAWETLNADVVMSEITKVLNSNESLSVDENLLVTIGSIDLPKGGGNSRKLPITSLFEPQNSVESKKSLFHVQNDNNLCLAISIGLCFLKTCQKVDANAWSQMMGDNSEQMLDFVLKHHTVSKTYYDNVLKTSRKKANRFGGVAV